MGFQCFKKIDNFIGVLSKIGIVMAGVCLLLMTGLICFEVIARSFFDYSTGVCDEMSAYLLIAVTFFGVSYTFKEDGFIRVDIIYTRIPEKWRNLLDISLYLLSFVYVITVLLYVWKYWMRTYMLQMTSNYISRTPLYIPQTVMVIGMFLLVLQMILCFCKLLIKKRATEQNSPKVGDFV